MGLAAKFSLGQIVATPAALNVLAESGQTPEFFIAKHQSGDWGLVNDEDRQLNEEALIHGDRILSAYKTLRGVKIWIITEATDENGDRAATTLLTPEEY
jgi:hypothetical protein